MLLRVTWATLIRERYSQRKTWFLVFFPENLHVLDHDLDVRIGPYCACTGDSARVPANAVVP
jgi:hypothetical protein